MTPPKRPRVICHMATSIDGRIVAEGWPAAGAMRRAYEQIHARYDAGAWMCGRITMEPFAGGVRDDDDVAREHAGTATREDFVARGTHASFAFALDPRGRLVWASSDIEGDHVVAVVTERVSDGYLKSLRDRHVSYLIAGAREIDLALTLEKIRATFNVETVMLEGGGRINGAMLDAGLVDEISLLVAPVADGRAGTPALFDVGRAGFAPKRLTLEAAERREENLLWLRYRVVSGSGR